MKATAVLHPAYPLYLFVVLTALSKASSQDEPLPFPEAIETKAHEVVLMSWLARIIGGTPVQAGVYPFFVRLDRNGQNVCGGTLIAPDLVLTAAHCEAPGLSVVFGGTSASTVPDGPGSPRAIVRTFPHPDFSKITFHNDYMIMKLAEPVNGVKLAQLRLEDDVPIQEGDNTTVIGLGYTSVDGDLPSSLLQAEVIDISTETCAEDYATLLAIDGIEVIIDRNLQFCAGSTDGGRDSCTGDSGGPIFDKNETQVGIVSFGFSCGDANFPGVYSKLSGAGEWIRQTMCSMTDFPTEECTKQNKVPTSSPTLYSTVGEASASSVDTTPPPDGLPNPAPRPLPVVNSSLCIDFDGQTFVVDGIDQEISCQWLRDRPIDRQSICERNTIAYLVCTQTCVGCEAGSTLAGRSSLSRTHDINTDTANLNEFEVGDNAEVDVDSDPNSYIRSGRTRENIHHKERRHYLHGGRPDDE